MMFWFARSTTQLLIARIFQGFSCAVVWTVGLALTVDTMGKEQVGAAMGVVSMGMTVGTVIGPSVGGIVYVSSLLLLNPAKVQPFESGVPCCVCDGDCADCCGCCAATGDD